MSYVTDSFDDEVVRLVKQGGIGLLPTDTIYGLSCLALNQKAAERINTLKQRGAEKAFIVLVADLKMLNKLSISFKMARILKGYWPGPVSAKLVAPRAPAWLLAPDGTLAVRIPNYDALRQLIRKTGPLISTSANLSGGPIAESADSAMELFGNKMDFYVNVGPLNNQPSTIVKVNNTHLEVIREGAVKIDEKETS